MNNKDIFLDKSIAVYGGSFSIPTMGHYHMIEKATQIFDIVYVTIAVNANKQKSDFPLEERLLMLKDMAHDIDPSDTKICITILPEHTYLADFAYQKGAKFLIRGIRDQIDFGYEQNIYRTNKKIQSKVETIYLMPDDAYNLVSSSWIRGIIGCRGWTEVIEYSVTPFVLNSLKRQHLKKIFMDLLKQPIFLKIMRNSNESIWSVIEKAYENNEYHGYSHLIDMLDSYDLYFPDLSMQDPIMKYAIFFHDIDSSEEKSAQIAMSNIRTVNGIGDGEDIRDKIYRLIMATKHNTCEYEKEDEKIIASLDLRILASNRLKYNNYVGDVFSEYLRKSGKSGVEFRPTWISERSAFLKKMLSRRVIFPWCGMDEWNPIAIENMKEELSDLCPLEEN